MISGTGGKVSGGDSAFFHSMASITEMMHAHTNLPHPRPFFREGETEFRDASLMEAVSFIELATNTNLVLRSKQKSPYLHWRCRSL